MKLKNRELEIDILRQEVDIMNELDDNFTQVTTVTFSNNRSEMDPSLSEIAQQIRQPGKITTEDIKKSSEDLEKNIDNFLKNLEKIKQLKKQIPR